MSNSAPTLDAILYLTHCHALLKLRQTEKKAKSNAVFPFHPQQHPSLQDSPFKTCCGARLWLPSRARTLQHFDQFVA